MTLKDFNRLNKEDAATELMICCGSVNWTYMLMKNFPFTSEKRLIDEATRIWYEKCGPADWKEAFAHHPKIGDSTKGEKKKSTVKKMTAAEQSGMNKATKDVVKEIASGNIKYEKKFGYIFIVCATGKSAQEMLQLLNDRIQNRHEEELGISMNEQHKITVLRIKKLLTGADWTSLSVSQITTHVLDTAIGFPGKDITIRLKHNQGNTFLTIAQGVTNTDGRIPDLLPPGKILSPGTYALVFETGTYFSRHKIKGFYPQVSIQFTVADDQHYHVPLLINPYGYTTYRGS